MVRDDPPDALVLDIGLPHLDGIEVAQQLRNQLAVPLIALTGYSPSEVGRSHFDRYLVKPVIPDELVNLLVELMEPQRQP